MSKNKVILSCKTCGYKTDREHYQLAMEALRDHIERKHK